jgi:hypothetical protein
LKSSLSRPKFKTDYFPAFETFDELECGEFLYDLKIGWSAKRGWQAFQNKLNYLLQKP